MITDDMIGANLERIARKRSGDRSLFGFPVIERDVLGDELRDAIAHTIEVSKSAPSGALTVIGTFPVTRALLEDETISTLEILKESLFRSLTPEDLEALALEWGLIDDDEERRIEAESNQRAIDASRAELRRILNGRH